ncbi:MAG: nickel-dependent lactate racemase [Proteobacteria bacterium]|nr:nickel-dependent lactate racemase [Pseudomonadota bacterium]MBU1451414.1 nickel-dependent lactate racemase [Pseudomonadota bacterium]MBU2468097.1 nickel-dependent lactate racemase [Pseudomonadota bacterium]MBU2516341.1 nickel-dependent lactate racemase [Pseudomonadota bacterium]
MPSVQIPCGREELTLELPAGAAVLQTSEVPPLADPAGALAAALADPLGGPPLARLARGKSSACIVVSDITRPVPNRLLLPPLLDTLLGAGVPREAVTILIATGMHRPNLGPEVEELLGPEVAGNWRVVNHDCQYHSSLEVVDTIQGAPIAVNRRYLEAQLKIVTGLIEPHPFAGFSGGGKSILPGLASLESMKFMHSFEMINHPGLRSGGLENNPFQEQVGRVARAAGLDFMLNVVIDRRRRPLGVFAGAFPEAFLHGCALAARQTVAPVDEPYDLVITSGGGHPLDATLYQASKGLLAAKAITRPGGTVLWITECAQGLGGEDYCRMVRGCATPRGFKAKHGDPANFVVDQWGAQAYFQCLEHLGRVLLYAPGLQADEARSFGLEWVEDLPAALAELCAGHTRVAVMPEGPYLSPLLTGGPTSPAA